MVASDDINMQPNKENDLPSKSRGLRILEKLKKSNAVNNTSQKTTQSTQIHKPQTENVNIIRRSQAHQVSSTIPKKYGEHKRFSRNQNEFSSSSSSSENRYDKLKTALQAKKYLRKYNELGQENVRMISSSSSVTPSDSESDQYWNCYEKIYDENKRDLDDIPTANVLHLKNSIINQENESLYYENRGRFPHIDWSTLNGTKSSEEIDSGAHASFQKLNTLPKFNELSKSESELRLEMKDMIENSTSRNTVYQVRGNIKKIDACDSPLLKLQKMMKKENKCGKIKIVEQIRQINKSQSDLYVINKIDSSNKMSLPVNNKTYRLEKLLQTVKEKRKNSEIESSDKILSTTPQNTVEFDSKDTLNTLSSGEGQRKNFEEVDDDLFDFVKPGVSTAPLLENSYDTLSSHMNSRAYLGNENANQRSRPMKPITQCRVDTDDGMFEFERPKNVLSSRNQTKKSYDQEKFNSTLDSDDTSIVRSSELDDASVTDQPVANAKFLSLRQKLMGFTTMRKDVEKTSMYGKSDSLLKETYSRYFRDSEKNVALSESVKTDFDSNKEVLLKPVSIRYFTKPSENIKNSLVQDHKETYSKSKNCTILNESEERTKTDPSSDNILVNSKSNNSIINRENIKMSVVQGHKETYSKSKNCSILNESEEQTETDQSSDNILINSKCNNSIIIKENCDTMCKTICEANNGSENISTIEDDNGYFIFHKHGNSDRYFNQEDSDEVEQTSLTESIVSVKNSNHNFVNKMDESSDGLSEIDSSTIFHKHKNINENSAIIQEINTESDETKSVNLDDSSKNEGNSCNLVSEYPKEDEDMYSDEEFDIVNIEQFEPCKQLIGKLMHLKAVQKAHATGKNTYEDLKATASGFEVNNNNKNLELVPPSNLSNRSWKVDENIFKDVKIDTNQWSSTDTNLQSINQNNEIEPNYHNITKSNDSNVDNKKRGPSKRMQKMKNGLVNLQKHLEKKNNEEESESVPSSSMGAKISRTNKNTRCNQSQILQQITKMNLHMNCKPFSSNR